MNIKLTPYALTQLQVIVQTHSNNTGFLLGTDMGKFKIIENLFPLNFTPTTIDAVYSQIYQSELGKKIMGVFFNPIHETDEPFVNEWFMEDLIMIARIPNPEFYLYDNEKKQYQHINPIMNNN
ncbi:MAG: hypothetical protein ACM3SY_10780 [Candidatus Omnitrophota bacterium]